MPIFNSFLADRAHSHVPLYLAVSLAISACHGESRDDSSRSGNAQRYVSGNPVCQLNVGQARALADRGDLASARSLRGYSWDCGKGDERGQLEHWGRIAAELGDRTDQKEYLKILLEARFDRGEEEWAMPKSCSNDEEAKYNSVSNGNRLVDIHRNIAFKIACTRDGIGPDILALAEQAAKQGTQEDVTFFNQLSSVRKARSQ